MRIKAFLHDSATAPPLTPRARLPHAQPALKLGLGKEQLTAAVSVNESTRRGADMIGPSVGGLLFTIGQIAPFLADTISYLISILSPALVKTTFQEERGVRATTLRQEVVEGLRWVWHQPLIRFSLFLVAGSNLLFLAVAMTACAMLGLAAAATLSRDVRSAPAIPEVQPT